MNDQHTHYIIDGDIMVGAGDPPQLFLTRCYMSHRLVALSPVLVTLLLQSSTSWFVFLLSLLVMFLF